MPSAIPAGAVGAFADLGGEVLTIEWVPDPEVIAQALLRVANYLDNIEKPLLASAAIARRDVVMRFDTETDPDGDAWTPLEPDYADYKESIGAHDTILDRWGSLRRAATSPQAWVIDGEDLFYDASGLPDYGLIHQAGSGDSSNIRSRYDYKESLRAAGNLKDMGSLGIGRGNALPQRRFIGISADAEEEIFNAFDIWFSEATNVYVSDRGVMQLRGPGGRFGARVL